ncbi:MAG: ABC transporter substrate binding protein [Coprobacillaceae bacterium]
MKRLVGIFTTLVLTLGLVGCGSDDGSSDSSVTEIGVIQLAEHPALDKAYEGFVAGLEAEGLKEGTDFTIDFKIAQGDRSNCQTIADKFVNNDVDLIYAIATAAAQAAATKTSDIPIVISSVTDPASSKLVENNDKPGTNVTGASDLTPIKEQIDLLKQLLPDTKKVAVMYCGSEDNSIFQADIAKEEIEAAGMEYLDKPVSDSSTIRQAAEPLVGKVDAIYIPTDNLLAEYMTTVSSVANENNLPCIVGEEGMVSNGGLATYGIDYYNLGLLAGKQAAQIIKGEKEPANMPIEYLSAEECTLAINKDVADKLGITIPQEILDKATIVGEE